MWVIKNEKITHYWSFSHTIGRVNICTYLLFLGTISYQLRDRLIEIKRLKTMNKVSMKNGYADIRKKFFDDEEKIRIKNLISTQKRKMLAELFNVITDHQVSDE